MLFRSSSTTVPMASTSANRVSRLTEKPIMDITANVPIMETKMDIVGISVDLISCKNTYTTTITRSIASISVRIPGQHWHRSGSGQGGGGTAARPYSGGVSGGRGNGFFFEVYEVKAEVKYFGVGSGGDGNESFLTEVLKMSRKCHFHFLYW